MGTELVFSPPAPNTFMISDEEELSNLTPVFENPEQYTSQIPQQRNHPVKLCQHVQRIPDTPKSAPPEDEGPKNIFRSYDLPKPLTSDSFNNLPNIWTVANGLQNLTLHACTTQWMGAGFLGCGKSYDQVVEETVADYLNQTAQPGETVRERQIKRNVFIVVIRVGYSFFFPRERRKLLPVMAGITPSITMDKTWAYRDTRCPYLKIKLTKLLLNILLDKFPPPSFL